MPIRTQWKQDYQFDSRILIKFYESWDRKKPNDRQFHFKVRYLGGDVYIHHSRSSPSFVEAMKVANYWIIAKIRTEPDFPRPVLLLQPNYRFEGRWS